MKKSIIRKNKIVLIVCVLVICLCCGFGYAWSVLQNPIITTYNWSSSAVALTYTVTVVSSTMAPTLLGSFIKKLSTSNCVRIGGVLFGCGLFLTGTISYLWQLYVFYGLMTGLGTGFIYPRLMAYIVTIHPKKAGLMSGLGTAAYGSGAILWAPVFVHLSEFSSLQTAFMIIGTIALVIILSGSFLLTEVYEKPAVIQAHPNDQDQEKSQNAFCCKNNQDLNRSQMIRTPLFYIILLTFVSALTAGTIIISQSAPILQDTLLFSPSLCAICVSLLSVCNMSGRFLFGLISDHIGLIRTMQFAFLICIFAMIMLGVSVAVSLVIMSMALAAACYGGFASVLTPLTAIAFGRRHISENYGVMYLVFGISALIGPTLTVFFKNAYGDYAGAFYTAAILASIGFLGVFFI